MNSAALDYGLLRRRSVLAAAAVALGLLLAGVGIAAVTEHAPVPFVAKTSAVYAICVAIMLRFLPLHLPYSDFGGANLTTLIRAGAISLLAGFVGAKGDPGWWPAGLAFTALALDGVDGWIARRTGRASGFGARFDMEVDSLGTLILAALVWNMGMAGAWIFLAGLLRYAFVALIWMRPSFAAPLLPSRRRRVICAFMVGALAAALVPGMPPFAAIVILLAAVAALLVSFAIDLVYLARRPGNSAADVAENAGKS